jgi:nucleoside-diphosphate-sugar epimerase
MTRFIVTGANGFVGQAVCRALRARGDEVIGVARKASGLIEGVRPWLVDGDDFASLDRDVKSLIHGDCVIHLAARVHVMRDTSVDPLAAYCATNVAGTLRVAQAARRAGARRFVYVSSIKALAESDHGVPLKETDPPTPVDPYGISKLEAEHALAEFGRQRGIEVAIVRPPLVYGPGVRANFLQLMRAIARGIPLPLGAIDARRSMVFVDNLADALVHCATDPRAAGQTFHVSDGHDLSVSELALTLARVLNVPPRLLPVSPSWLRIAGRLTGRSAQVDRLIGSLQLDISHIRETLGWQPPHSVEHGLLETANWYRATH